MDASSTPAPRQRDAEGTRDLLLQAARKRFALDGYGSTTVRDIAADVGVNVALINRYFTSKEGLFEACLTASVRGLDQSVPDASIDDLMRTMARHVTGPRSGERSLQLLVLLRSSGDAAADDIRRSTLESFSERMAAVAGWRPGDPDTEGAMLRAQIALSTLLGIVLLRSSTGLEPLTAVDENALAGPLGEVLGVLLSPR